MQMALNLTRLWTLELRMRTTTRTRTMRKMEMAKKKLKTNWQSLLRIIMM
jgi:hypothetical protein